MRGGGGDIFSAEACFRTGSCELDMHHGSFSVRHDRIREIQRDERGKVHSSMGEVGDPDAKASDFRQYQYVLPDHDGSAEAAGKSQEEKIQRKKEET